MGSAIQVTADSLPANHAVTLFISTQQVETGQTDNDGSIRIRGLIPLDISPGLNQVSIYADGTAVAAECVLNVLSDIQLSTTVAPVLTPTTLSNPSTEIRDSIRIWESYIGLHGQEDHLIFHVITTDTSLIPKSFQIVDAETGQVTDSFPLQVSPFPNLCAAEPRKGKSYYRTEEIFFKDLPPDFWARLNGTSFTYVVEVEQPTGEQVSIAITDTPGGCMSLVE